jgi:hypothetical protein
VTPNTVHLEAQPDNQGTDEKIFVTCEEGDMSLMDYLLVSHNGASKAPITDISEVLHDKEKDQGFIEDLAKSGLSLDRSGYDQFYSDLLK